MKMSAKFLPALRGRRLLVAGLYAAAVLRLVFVDATCLQVE
jgi:hypothetical protein